MNLQKTGYNTESQKLRYYSTTALTSARTDPAKQIANTMRPLRAPFGVGYDPGMAPIRETRTQDNIGMTANH